MEVLNLVSFNVRAPHIAQLDTLQVTAYGLNVLLEGHKGLGLCIDDYTLMEHAKLTMGDHAAELCRDDLDFTRIYKNATNLLTHVLATQGDELTEFAKSLNSIDDVMVFEYPGLIRLCIKEGTVSGASRSSLLYLTQSCRYSSDPY